MKHSEIFYFDVDGTLLDNKTHTVSEATVLALKKLKALGYHCALCTGRTLDGIQEAEVDKLIPWDGYVLANGSLIYDADLKLIHKSPFDPSFVEKMMKLSKGPLLLEGNFNFYTDTPHQPIIDALEHFKITDDYPVLPYENQDIFNIKCYEKFDDEIIKDLEKDAQVLYDQMNNYEIIPLTSGKDKGIEIINELYSISRHTVFGDGDNDVTMIQKADVGVAMANGTDKVKHYADYITKSVEEDGIVEALKAYELI